MAGGGKQERTAIRDLLDDFIDVQKQDTWEITSGHLNESKLWNPKDASRVPWESSSKPFLRLKESSKLQNHPKSLPPIKMKSMTDAVMDFMLGPTGGMGLAERTKHTTPISPSPELSFIDKVKKIPSDKQLIQELELPELMLPLHSRKDKSKESLSNVKYEFLTSHHALPTKLDQYSSMKDFEKIFMQKKDAQERQALTGAKEIAKIEKRLRRRLEELERRHIIKGVPSFYTLQVYSDCWEDLIENSKIYRQVLRRIKDEYDANISLLLDSQDKQNNSLHEQLSVLSSRSFATTDELRNEEKHVENLEKMAMEALNKNESLRQKLKEEKEDAEYRKYHTPDRNQQPVRHYTAEEKKKDLEEQVQELHGQIEKQLILLEEMKRDQKENHVPVIVCQRLEQGIKETEVDIQKLLKQNEFLENNIENLEEELENLLLECGAKENDTRALWRKINTSKLQNLDKR